MHHSRTISGVLLTILVLASIPIGAFLGSIAFVCWTCAIFAAFMPISQFLFGFDPQDLVALSFAAIPGTVVAMGIGAVTGPVLIGIAFFLPTGPGPQLPDQVAAAPVGPQDTLPVGAPLPDAVPMPASSIESLAEGIDPAQLRRFESIMFQLIAIVIPASLVLGMLAGLTLCSLVAGLFAIMPKVGEVAHPNQSVADALGTMIFVAAVNIVPFLSLGIGVGAALLLRQIIFRRRDSGRLPIPQQQDVPAARAQP